MPPQSPTVPLDTLWQTRTLGWVLLAGEGIALVLSMAPNGQRDVWVFFGLSSLVIQWILLLTLGILYLFRRQLRSLRVYLLAWIILGIIVCCTLLVGIVTWSLLEQIPAADGSRENGDAVPFLIRLVAMAATCGALGLAAFQNYWLAHQLAIRTKQAELAALQARVRPHFLFNTLNTGAALVHHRPDEAEELLLDLADLFRAALSGHRNIPLREEISLIERYLEIEALRFRERLRVLWQLPDPMPDTMVPVLSLQPLVENAIKHGIERIPGGGEIGIRIEQLDDTIVITIDNPTADEPPGSSAGHNVGLPASLAQIEAYTEGRGSVKAHASEGRFTVTVRLPAKM